MTDTELNMAVAKAAGIEVFTLPGITGWHRDSLSSPGNAVRWQPLHPTLGWNDAWEAAEKVGLFHPSEFCGRLEQVMGMAGTEWSVSWIGDGYEEKTMDVAITKGPRALCEAIVAMKGGK